MGQGVQEAGGGEGTRATRMEIPNLRNASTWEFSPNPAKFFFRRESDAVLPKALQSPNPKFISFHSKSLEGLLKRSDDGGSSPSSSSNLCMTWASSLPLSLSLLSSKSGDKIEPTPRFALRTKGACWHRRSPLEERVAVSYRPPPPPPMTLSC